MLEGDFLFMDMEKVEEGVRLILEGIGEDPSREGLVKTPNRVARMYQELFAGLNETPEKHFETLFDVHHDEVVLVGDIPFYSMCEHHLAPFYGKAHIAYIPGKEGKVCGLSKLARTLEVYAKRPQIQERLTNQVADALVEYMNPAGVFIMIEAEHTCMTMRGIKKPGSLTTTTASRGVLVADKQQRNEILSLMLKRN